MKTRTGARFWLPFVLGGAGTAVVIGLWSGLATPRVASGTCPYAGLQRNEMVKELRTSNQKLTEIAGLLREIRDIQKGGGGERQPTQKPKP